MSRHRDALRRGIRSLIHDTSRELADLEGREPPPEIPPPQAPGGPASPQPAEVRPAPDLPPSPALDGAESAAAPPVDAAPPVEAPPVGPVPTGAMPSGMGTPPAETPAGGTRPAAAPVEPVHGPNERTTTKAVTLSETPGGMVVRQEPPRARGAVPPPRPEASQARSPGASGPAAARFSAKRPPAAEPSRAARGSRPRRAARPAAPKERSRAGRTPRAGASSPRGSARRAGGGDRARPARRRAAAGIPMDGVDPQQANARKGVCFAYFIKHECWRVPNAYCNTALHVCVMRDCPVYHLHRDALERRFAGKYKHFW